MGVRVGLAGLVVASCLLGGCAAPGATSTGTPAWTIGGPATPVPGTTSEPSPPPGSSTFSGWGMEFDYPAAWNRSSFEVLSSFYQSFVFLSTAPLADPCDRTANSVSCTRQAVAALAPDGILVTWSSNGVPGWSFDPSGGSPNPVGGRAATLAEAPADEVCRAIGGDELIVATIPIPDVQWDWNEMRACLRGPDLATLRALVTAMLASVRWTSP